MRSDARSPARRARLVSTRRSSAARPARRRHRASSANTQINRLSAAASCPSCSRRSSRTACTAGRSSSPSRWGAPPTSPTCCSSPTTCSSCFRCSRGSQQRCDEAACVLWPGNNIGYFGPLRVDAARHAAARAHGGRAAPAARRSASKPTARSRAARRCRRDLGGRQRPRASLRDIWERAAPLRFTRDRTVDDLWGFCRTCYYADECSAGCTWTA